MMNLGLMDPAFLGSLSQLWTPAQISTALWLDAADSSTVVLSGSKVTQWNDKSGNGNHVSNATTSTQPIYSATGFNSKPCVQFTATGEEFLFNGAMTGFAANNDFFLVAVFEALQENRDWEMICGWRSVANSATLSSTDNGVPVLQFPTQAAQIGIHNTSIADTRIVVNISTRVAKRIASVGRTGGTNGNGGSVTVSVTEPSQANYITTATQTWTSGSTSGFQIGGRQQEATFYGSKNIAEIIGCPSNVSNTTFQQLKGYLAHRWGLTANLPSDHPYKVSPPYV